ncbi:hypothetical protein [endosymbiont of Ridgeia piscesae]|uniref:Cytochrome C n=1 Tax=endosymbiont of Ridgeia piscesae TaxID=54398 RepID=A0A0T5YXD2_9GAMM|nr:hypothetical protein [endosymbiont of Ridgeia piscesae]KRT55212.1 hypothetical protein Ga0074115_11535 [endosymbiont of Ridgeia piscesae]KRT59636.1 hypothetical protein Ga0076813_15844 [endosymbiont of Ridgeia piscesae]
MRSARNENNTFQIHSLRRGLGLLGVSISMLLCAGVVVADKQQPKAADMQQLQQMMKKQIGLMKPELQKRVKALSPKTKKMLLSIYAQHSRHSDKVTLRQVMHEVLSDYQSMAAGIMTDNAEQAADSARRLANHRIPRGGLLPYMSLEMINDDSLAALDGFNASVEGTAKRLADAAEQGDMGKAASYMDDITGGCVGCHAMFRGIPGQSDLLR